MPVRKSNSYKRFDIFGESVHLNVRGREKHGTTVGALLTFAIVIFVLTYGVQKGIKMVTYQSYRIFKYERPIKNKIDIDYLLFDIISTDVASYPPGTTYGEWSAQIFPDRNSTV